MSSMFRFGLVFLGILALAFFLKNQKGNAEDQAVNNTLNNGISVDFKELHGELSESEIVAKYGDLKLSCSDESSPIAERYCYSAIPRFNGMDAKQIVFFFEKDKLNQVKVDVQANSNDILTHYIREYGMTTDVKKREGMPQLVTWILRNGMLITSKEENNNQGMLLWVSSMKMLSTGLGSK